MSNFTQADWAQYAKMYSELETFATEYVKEFGSFNEDFTSLSIDDDIINGEPVVHLTINAEAYFSGCGTEYASYNIPFSWVGEPDLMERCRKQQAEQKEQEQKRQDELKQKRVDDDRTARHKKFLELQEEFETN